MNKEELKILELAKGYFFGCIDVAGHYVHHPRGYQISSQLSHKISCMDGKLNPQFDDTEGLALLHHFDGFTILAFHDYSVDKRSGSNSMFIFPGKLNLQEMLELANQHFPKVMKRFNFEIKQVN